MKKRAERGCPDGVRSQRAGIVAKQWVGGGDLVGDGVGYDQGWKLLRDHAQRVSQATNRQVWGGGWLGGRQLERWGEEKCFLASALSTHAKPWVNGWGRVGVIDWAVVCWLNGRMSWEVRGWGGEILSRKKYLTSIVSSKGVLGTPQSKTKTCNETYVGLLSEISVIILFVEVFLAIRQTKLIQHSNLHIFS